MRVRNVCDGQRLRAPVVEEDGVRGCMSPALRQRQQLLVLHRQLPRPLHRISDAI